MRSESLPRPFPARHETVLPRAAAAADRAVACRRRGGHYGASLSDDSLARAEALLSVFRWPNLAVIGQDVSMPARA
jgi:hypothetical protein